MSENISDMGGPSLEVVSIADALVQKKPSPVAVDLGSGDGRNSVYLGELGFEVFAIEEDRLKAEVLCGFSERLSLKIVTSISDVREFSPPCPIDLVLILGILHFLPKFEAKALISRLKNSTPPNGVHVITISFNECEEMPSSFMAQQGHLNSFNSEDTLLAYADWDLIAREDYVKTDYHNNGITDKHPIQKFIFQKATDRTENLNAQFVEIQDSEIGRAIFTNIVPKMLSERTYYEIQDIYGEPDFEVLVKAKRHQFSLLGRVNIDQKFSFWGRTKCYFEGDVLIGVARYKSDRFFSSFSFEKVPEE